MFWIYVSFFNYCWFRTWINMIGPYSRLNFFKLSHFKHFRCILARCDKAASFGSYKITCHCWSFSVWTNTIEFLQCLINLITMFILPFLRCCCIKFKFSTHYWFHWSGRSIWFTKWRFNLFNINSFNFKRTS